MVIQKGTPRIMIRYNYFFLFFILWTEAHKINDFNFFKAIISTNHKLGLSLAVSSRASNKRKTRIHMQEKGQAVETKMEEARDKAAN